MAFFSIESFRTSVQKVLYDIRAKLGTSVDDRIGVPTGFSEFDRRTRGLQNGKVYVVAARPGGGKTSWVTTVMANIAMGQPHIPLLMFSTELTEEEIIMQIVEAYAGGIPIYPNNRTSRPDEIEKLEAALMAVGDQVNRGLIKVDFKKKISLEYLNETMANLDDNGAVVFIDQASRIERDDAGGKRAYHIATEQMVNSIEVIAEIQNVPVVLVTQLNRTAEYQKHATMANLKHSGSFEELAHAVYLLEKDEGHGQRKPGSAWVTHGAVCHVAKTRHGQTGPVSFNFYGECHTWKESTEREET